MVAENGGGKMLLEAGCSKALVRRGGVQHPIANGGVLGQATGRLLPV